MRVASDDVVLDLNGHRLTVPVIALGCITEHVILIDLTAGARVTERVA